MVTGYGAADKSQVAKMIAAFLGLNELPRADAADALAVALCHASVLATGMDLSFSSRTGILESLQDDPDGELTIEVPSTQLDDLATVLAVDLRDTPRRA
jgi:hypothetical protein